MFTCTSGAEAWRLDLLTRAVNAVSQPVLIAQADGTFIYVNAAMEQLLRSEPGGLAGANAWEFVANPEDRARILQALVGAQADKHVVVRVGLRTRSGAVLPAELAVTVFWDEESGAELGIVIARDLTEENRAEAERVMRERQLALMLREAHHRIKNTLQVASDILALQGSTSSPEVREALGAAAKRIHALAAVHEGLRVDRDVTEVEVRPLISAVIHDLRDAYTGERPVKFEIALEERPVPSHAASGLALIATELVANALEHGRPSTVCVSFEINADTAVFEVRDDGPRQTPVLGPHAPGFGLNLVRILAEDQLQGAFSLNRDQDWTVARVAFPWRPTGSGASLQTLSETQSPRPDK